MKKLSTIHLLLLVFIFGFGCGSSDSASQSAGSVSNSGNQIHSEGPESAPAPVTEVLLHLVDPVNQTIEGVEIFIEMPLSESIYYSSLADTSTQWVALQTCGSAEQTDCLTESGEVKLACQSNPRTVVVKKDEEVLQSFQVTCQYGHVVYQIPNSQLIFAFSVDSRTNELVEHQVNPETLQIVEIGRFPTGQSPKKIARHPTNNMLYGLNHDDHNISTFHVSGISGNVKEMLPRLGTGANPLDLSVHPSGDCLYVTNAGNPGSISPYAITSGGLLTAVADVNMSGVTSPTALAISPNGLHAYLATAPNAELLHYTVDTQTCALTLADKITTDFMIRSLMVNEDGSRLYVSGMFENGFSYYGLNVDGSLSKLATSIAKNLPDDPYANDFSQILLIGKGETGEIFKVENGGLDLKEFELDRSGQFAYATNVNDSTVQVYLLAADCSLIPFFTTVQGGDSLGAIVNMMDLPQGNCTKGIYIPGKFSRSAADQSIIIPE